MDAAAVTTCTFSNGKLIGFPLKGSLLLPPPTEISKK